MLAAGALSAQEAVDGGPEVEPARLAPVVVTARRGGQTEIFEEPSTVHALDRADLDRQLTRTLPEALWDVPGVMIQKTSNGQGSPFLRGFTSFRTLLLIDGVRLNNSVFRPGPNQYWATIDPLTIDRIEVVKGPTSSLYGSDAIGGVVQAITKQRETYELDLGWGATATGRFAEAERSATGRVEFEGNVEDSMGWIIGTTGAYFGDVRQGSGSRQDTTGYWQQAGDAKVTLFPSDDVTLTIAHYEFDQNRVARTHSTDQGTVFHGTTVGGDRSRDLDQDRHLTYARLEVERGPFYRKMTVIASIQEQEEEEKRERSNGRRQRQGFTVVTPALQLQFETESTIGIWTYGVEWYHDEVDSERRDFNVDGSLRNRRVQGPVADDASYDMLGLFVQDEIDLADDLLTVVVGARYTQIWLDADQVVDPVAGGSRKLSADWPSFVGNLRLLGRATDWLHLFAGVNQGFRAPNLSDMTRFDSARSGEFETPTTDLDPEHYLSFEVGAKVEYEGLRFQGAYFYTRIWDMILRQPTGNVVGGDLEVTKANVGDGFVHGVEGEVVYEFLDRWRASAHISWQESLVEQFPTSAPVIERDNLSRMQPLTWGGALRYTAADDRWYAEVSSRFTITQDRPSPDDRRDTQRISPGGTPGYAVFTARAGWRATDHLTLSAAVENLTDANYRILGSGQQEPGINAILGMELRFP